MGNTAFINKKTLRTALTIFIAGMLFLTWSPGFAAPASGLSVPQKMSEVPRISPQGLKGMLDRKKAVLIADVRPVSAFNAQHIAGAISVPLSEVSSSLDELLRDKTIVFY